jgi:hypothetical protein
MVWTTGADLAPISASIERCETDLALLTQNHEGRVQLVIGECKSFLDKISEDDVTNMIKVADSFAPPDVQVFIVFAKLAEFSREEINHCSGAQGTWGKRVIMLSDRELEPYEVYERAAKEYDIKQAVTTLEDLVENTDRIYFDPKKKTEAN